MTLDTNLREDGLNPGAGDMPPTDVDTQAAAAAGQGAEAGSEKEPWHNDPRFQKFLAEKKEVETRLETLRRKELEDQERRELESVKPAVDIPEEMPLPSKEDFEQADFTDTQAEVMRKFVEAAVHNDRRRMALAYAEAQKRSKQQQILGDRKRREILLEAERDFGNKEFGSLGDVRSPLRQRAEVVLRANPEYQSSPLGIYRACKDAYEELSRASGSRGRSGEEMISGRQAGGATLPGPSANFKRVDERTYNSWPKEKQEAYDRASVGLPPEE